jgi:hypothetical protein
VLNTLVARCFLTTHQLHRGRVPPPFGAQAALL